MPIQGVIGVGITGHNAAATLLTLEQRTIYNRNLLSRLLPNLVYMMFGQVAPMPQNAGQTIQFRKFESLAIPGAALVEGVTPNPRDLAMSSITVTPEQWGDHVVITDVLDFTAPDPVLMETGGLLGEQAALTMDSKVRDVIVAGTNVQYCGASSSSRVTVGAADKLTAAEIQKAVRTLHTNKASKLTGILNASTGVGSKPIAASFVGIIGPSTLYDLKQDAKFVPVHEYAQTTQLLPYEVGSVDEVRFVMTHNAPVFAAAGEAGIDVHATIILGRDAFGIVSPFGIENIIKPFGAGDDPLNQRASSGWKAFFKAVRLYEAACLRLEHSAS